MSDIRYDPLTDRWTIIAAERAFRPDDFSETQVSVNLGLPCPFCAGNEGSTPPATWVSFNGQPQDPESSQWDVRVVPNRFPAVDDCAQPWAHGRSHPLFESYPVIGGHEIVIESPKHIQSISELSPRAMAIVFDAFVDRLRYWNERPEIEYTIIFKNVGAAAGASLRHTHCQVVALSRLPPAIGALQKRLVAHREEYGVCLLCDMLAEERRQQVRVVCETEHLIAFCPFASYLPYLVRIAPLKHAAAFERSEGIVIEEAGVLLRRMVCLLERAFSETAYNFFLQSCPAGFRDHDAFHWWIDLFPRISKQAGFEWGCHGQINPIPPEQAAQHMRRLDQLFEVTEQEGRT